MWRDCDGAIKVGDCCGRGAEHVGCGKRQRLVIYTYTGNDFTNVTGPFTTSNYVTGSVTLSAALGDNLGPVMVTPNAFSFSDGVDTISSTNPVSYGPTCGVGTIATCSAFLFSQTRRVMLTHGWSKSLIMDYVYFHISTYDNPGILAEDFGGNLLDTGTIPMFRGRGPRPLPQHLFPPRSHLRHRPRCDGSPRLAQEAEECRYCRGNLIATV